MNTHAHYEAAPISTRELEQVAVRVRELLGYTGIRRLPVAQIIEHALPTWFGDDFEFRVGTRAEMGTNHGHADPFRHELVLREDVYEGMITGVGRDRMTAIHEFSHLVLHGHGRLYRRLAPSRPPPFRCPEWQAKCLAGAIMVPASMIDCRTWGAHQIAQEFGISVPAAEYRVNQIRRLYAATITG